LSRVARSSIKASMSSSRAFAPLDLLQIVAVATIWGVNNVAAKIALMSFPPLLEWRCGSLLC